MAITAAGTVADFTDTTVSITAFPFQIDLTFKTKSTINAFANVMEILLSIALNLWIIHHLSTIEKGNLLYRLSLYAKYKFGVESV